VQEIGEVVVMGYGTNVAKRDVIATISSISADKIAERSPVDVIDALQGEMAGVQITSSSGAPGAEMNIRVRGISTIEGSGVLPLFIVDGVVMESISNINPNDIKSIDVMKDGASAAIYGARAANGVVIVTTKTAEEGKMRLDINFLQTYGFLAHTLPQPNRREAEIFANTIWSVAGRDQFNWFGSVTDSTNIAGMTSYYYQDEISQIAKRNNINLSASGGGKQLKYFTSVGYLDDEGSIRTSYMKRGNLRSKVDYTPYELITLTTNAQFSYQVSNAINEGNVLNNALRRFPQTVIYFPTDGTLFPRWAHYPSSNKYNPMLELQERENVTERYTVNLSEAMELRFDKYLKLKLQGSANIYYNNQEQYLSALTSSAYEDYIAGRDDLSLTKTFYRNLLGEAYLQYSRTFFDKHRLNAMLGTSAENTDTEANFSGGLYLINKDIRIPQGSSQPKVATRTGSGNSIASFFGRLDYDYSNQYMFNFTLRRDGSSRFGTKNRWGYFPAVQGGWRFSEHLKDTKIANILEDGKLRVTWGITGNDRVGNYDAQTLFTGAITSGYNGVLGVIPNAQYGNPYLKWEETEQANYGLDLVFLNGRLNISGDYYVKRTNGLLDNEILPPELGYTTMRVNTGSIENKGLEITITGQPIKTKDWRWQTSINWSRNRNKILELAGEGEGRIISTNWWAEAGLPAGNFYGFKHQGVYAYDVSNAYNEDFSERLFPVLQRNEYGNVMFDNNKQPVLLGYQYADGRAYGGEVKQMTVNNSIARGGDVIWDDYDRNGVIDNEDKQVLGNAYSDWYAGWNNTVSWRSLTLNLSIYYNHGGLIYNQTLFNASSYSDNTTPSDPRPTVQGWRVQGQITDWYVPGQNAHPTANNRSLSSFYLEDGTFLRLKNVRLSYKLPMALCRKLFVNTVQVFASGTNLLTWTNYRGYDPEVISGGVLNPNADNARYPKKREIGLGLNITF
jgi:TonB-linked SusC/RagA family outer membrane protein